MKNKVSVYAKRKKVAFFILIVIIMIIPISGYFQSKKSFAASEEEYINKDPKLKQYVGELKQMSKNEPKIKTLINNIEDYPKEIIKLVVNNPEIIDFALDYPKNKNKDKKIKLSNFNKKDGIPLFIQWDEQWGYSKYGDRIIAINGCGPTCLSMVAVGLTEDKSMNPKKVAEFSYNNGYMDQNGNTTWALMTKGARELGLQSKEIPLDKNSIINELKSGHPIILSVKKGDFTKEGHFIVLKGVASDGKILVNDPNSNIRSNKTWDIDRLMKQTKGVWAFSPI